eukprot:m.133372 g.133372  ORF g.133372 m.133372 type:complete len:362 (+) comp20096_c0_seq1:136-1221(+)
MKSIAVLSLLTLTALTAAQAPPMVMLKNAAQPGLAMPSVGLGTYGYGLPGNKGGEFWNDTIAYPAVRSWLSMNGIRIDGACDYKTQYGVGKAIVDSGIDRKKLFLTSKIDIRGAGPSTTQYDWTMAQFKTIQAQLQTSYVDLLLIHWPGDVLHVKDPNQSKLLCASSSSYRPCRQEAWLALQDIFRTGGARAIGVSNFGQKHIAEIEELQDLLPAVNQIEYHPYWHEDALRDYCQSKNIAVQSYSPLGAPDHMATEPQLWPVLPTNQTVVQQIAAAVNATPAQVVLAWAWQRGVSCNPRTWRADHMAENLAFFHTTLSAAQLAQVDDLLSQPGAPNTDCSKPPMPEFFCTNKVCPNPNVVP